MNETIVETLNISSVNYTNFQRAHPRKVCTVLGNGVAIFCDRNCYHGEYDSKADDSEHIDQDVFKWV